jgi:hypothetical protein
MTRLCEFVDHGSLEVTETSDRGFPEEPQRARYSFKGCAAQLLHEPDSPSCHDPGS